MKAYCDTSFLCSLYVPDSHSSIAAAMLDDTPGVLLISALTEVELVNAIVLRRFRKELNRTEVSAAQHAFQADVAAGVYSLHPLSAAVFEKAKQLSGKYTARLGTRSLDILHVACALSLRADVIYSFDHVQSSLAVAVGLPVTSR